MMNSVSSVSNCNIQAPAIIQESDLLVLVGSYSRENDHVPLVALESIGSLHFDVQSAVEALLTPRLFHGFHLHCVRGNDTDAYFLDVSLCTHCSH